MCSSVFIYRIWYLREPILCYGLLEKQEMFYLCYLFLMNISCRRERWRRWWRKWQRRPCWRWWGWIWPWFGMEDAWCCSGNCWEALRGHNGKGGHIVSFSRSSSRKRSVLSFLITVIMDILFVQYIWLLIMEFFAFYRGYWYFTERLLESPEDFGGSGWTWQSAYSWAVSFARLNVIVLKYYL